MENRPRSSRLRIRTRTGCCGCGKRTDSWKARVVVLASSVLAHSPKMVEKPREYSTLPDLMSTTSSILLPRLLSSMGRARLPAHGRGSTSTRSTA
ncbi:hypothetical protein D3C72_1774990 [compost metagenome]